VVDINPFGEPKALVRPMDAILVAKGRRHLRRRHHHHHQQQQQQ